MINSNEKLGTRINNFLSRKTEQYPDLPRLVRSVSREQ